MSQSSVLPSNRAQFCVWTEPRPWRYTISWQIDMIFWRSDVSASAYPLEGSSCIAATVRATWLKSCVGTKLSITVSVKSPERRGQGRLGLLLDRLLHRAIPEYNMSRAGCSNCELASPWVNKLYSIEVPDDDWIAPRWSSAPVPTRRMLVLCTTGLRFLLAGLSKTNCGYRPFSLYFSLSSLK